MNDSLPDDSHWLRETVPDDLAGLFSDSRRTVQMTIRELLDRIPYDRAVESRLIECLEVAVTEQNDDTQGSIWVALLLAEAGVEQGIPVLIFALEHGDEDLQHAVRIAILKLGTPAVTTLLGVLEDDVPSEALQEGCLELLGNVGHVGDEALTNGVIEMLRGKLEEVFGDGCPPASIVERSALALSRLGDRGAIELIRRVQKEHFDGLNPVLADAIEWLDENDPGVVVVGDHIPGEEDYLWAFEYAPDAASRSSDAGDAGDKKDQELDDSENFYRGLGTPIEDVDGYWDDARNN